MRLICPDCAAQYEVDDTAIPPAGRDVQCSNCDHAWFQRHPGAAPPEPGLAGLPGQSAAPALAVDPADSGVPAQAEVSLDPPPPLPGPPVSPDDAALIPRRVMDENVLSVLREEAARETALRRAETTPAADLPPDKSAKPPPALSPQPEPLPEVGIITPAPRATARPGQTGPAITKDAMAAQDRRRFRQRFLLIVLVAALLTAAYIRAPEITAAVPAAEPVLQAYVALVDQLRRGIDRALLAVSTWIGRLTGPGG